MANEILDATKDLLGIPADETSFDTALVFYINQALFTLEQLGVGTDTYQVTAEDGSFDVFLPGEDTVHATLQMYIFFKVRLGFDPPTSSFVLASVETQIKELEFRLLDYSTPSTPS